MDDLIGQRFSYFTVKSKISQGARKRVLWLCLCDCGNEYFATTYQLTKGMLLSCGCHRRRDLSGQRFGKLVALEYVGKGTVFQKGVSKWLCQCDCGRKKVVSLKGLYTTRSCGCLKKRVIDDLTGQRFERLVVKERAPNKNNCVMWLCHCDCGQTKVIHGQSLKRGATKSCGCLRIESRKKNIEDITGQRFDRLVVIKRAPNKNSCVMWLCQCDCGQTKIVHGQSLKRGVTRSCGCLRVDRLKKPKKREIS